VVVLFTVGIESITWANQCVTLDSYSIHVYLEVCIAGETYSNHNTLLNDVTR